MQASRTDKQPRNYSSVPKQNTQVYRSKQCPVCRTFIPGQKYQQHTQTCVSSPATKKKIVDPNRKTTYGANNQSNMGRIFIKQKNNEITQGKFSSLKPSPVLKANLPNKNKSSTNNTDLLKKRRVSVNQVQNKTMSQTRNRFGISQQKKQELHNQDDIEIKAVFNQSKIDDHELYKQESDQKTQQQQVHKYQEQTKQQKKQQSGLKIEKLQISEQKQQAQLNSQIKIQEQQQSSQKRPAQIRIRSTRPSSANKSRNVSHQVRLTQIHNDLVRKYNQNPQRITNPATKKQQQEVLQMTADEKSKWEKQKQRQRKLKQKMERERQRQRQRQKALQRQRQIQRQRAQQQQRQKKQQQQRIRRQQRQQINQIRRAQNQPNLIRQNINIHPVYNQTAHNLFLLISIANQLINYIQNYSQEDLVVLDMLSQVRRINQMVASLSEHIVTQNSHALTMVNTYARRSQQIQQIIFSQLQTVLISNLSQYNDQQLLSEIRQNIQNGLNNIRQLEFPLLPVHNIPQTMKFTSKQIQETFPPRLAFSDDQCSICLDEIKRGSKIKQLQCGHLFHPTCIDEWLLESRKCPMCRNQQKLQQ